MPLTNVIEIHLVLLFTLRNTKNIAYHITEVLIFYAYKLILWWAIPKIRMYPVFNFTILLKSRNFDARETYMFYSIIFAVSSFEF